MSESKRRHASRCGSQIIATAVLLMSLIGCSSIQNYSSAKISANETAAIQSLRSIGQAQMLYFNTRGRKSFATMKQLSDDQLISPDLAAGEKNGYRFIVRIVERSETRGPAYDGIATPVNYGSSGKRSFYINEDGVIRHADKNGAEATAKDPALN
jgi:hypothetical protein